MAIVTRLGLRARSLLPVALAAALAAVPAAQARTQHEITVSNVSCTPSYTTVTCSFKTSVATAASLATGTSKGSVIPTTDSGSSTSHSITVRGLEPGTDYVAELGAANRGGKLVWTRFGTLGPGAKGDAPVTVRTSGRRWLLDGEPFLPVIGYVRGSDCIEQSQAAKDLAAGARIALVDQLSPGFDCGSTRQEQIATVHAALAGRMWWNFGADLKTLTRDTGDPAQAEVIDWPSTHWVDFGAGNELGSVNIGGNYDGLFWLCSLKHLTIKPGPLSGGLYSDVERALARGPLVQELAPNECYTPVKLATEFWTSAGQGAGVAYAGVVKPASQLAWQLATIAPVILYGKPLKLQQPPNVPVPVWRALYEMHGQVFRVVREKPQLPVQHLLGWRYGGRVYVLALSEGFASTGKVATHWNTHVNGVWHHYTWHWPAMSVKLEALSGDTGAGLFGAKGLKLSGDKASITMGALGSGWYVFTPRRGSRPWGSPRDFR